jgi:hypothetical protein
MTVGDAKPPWFNREIIHSPTRDFDIEAVKHVQRVLRVPESGVMDEGTRQHIRGMQNLCGLAVTGTINLETAKEIDRLVQPGAW